MSDPLESADRDFIERALLASTESDGSAGCRVVSAGAGVCEADLRELAAWGPACDAAHGWKCASVEPELPSAAERGLLCQPYQARGVCGRRATGALDAMPDRSSGSAGPVRQRRFRPGPGGAGRGRVAGGRRSGPARGQAAIAGRGPPDRRGIAAGPGGLPGAAWMAALVQASLDWMSIGIRGGPPVEQLIAGLIHCFPPGCRTEFSFSTGLRFSPQRPLRIVALPPDRHEQRRLEPLYNLSVLRLGSVRRSSSPPLNTWARLVLRVLRERPGIALGPLVLPAGGNPARRPARLRPGIPGKIEVRGGIPAQTARGPLGKRRRAACFRSGPTDLRPASGTPHESCPSPLSASPPSRLIDPHDPEVLRLLEKLDDLVFAAITGPPEVVAELRSFWPQVRGALDESLLIESREQYLRYAFSLWEGSAGPEGVCRPERAVPSLDVLCLLLGDN